MDELKIAWITAENVMGISRAKLELGNGKEVHGDNGSGKTSLLSALQAVVQSRGSGDLVRVGEDKGFVLLRLEGNDEAYNLQRPMGKSLKVTHEKDGVEYTVQKPQAFVESIFGELAFDPLEFGRSEPKDALAMFQRAFPCTIKGLVDDQVFIDTNCVPVESYHALHGFKALERLLEEAETRRRDVGRVARQKRAAADEADPKIKEPILYNEEKHLKLRETLSQANDELATVDQQNKRIKAQNAEIERADREIKRFKSELKKAESRRKKLGEPQEFVDREEKEKIVGEINTAMNEWATMKELKEKITSHEKLDEEAKKKEESYKTWTSKIEWLRKDIAQKLAEQIGSPIEGLTVEGGHLKINDVPLEQINTADQIRIGLQITAALQKDKPVKFVAVDNAEHMTPVNRERLAEEAEKMGMQWLFLVVSDPSQVPKGAVYMEDGTLDD